MASITVKKKTWQRRRFIPSDALLNLHAWMDVAEDLKQRIFRDSTFQLLGNKTILEMNSQTGQGRVLLEVTGVPRASFESFDTIPTEVLVMECPESVFNLDFMTLKNRAAEVQKAISAPVALTYHIVLSGTKLELHFFVQKDYIQTTH